MVNIEPFEVEQWMDRYENECKYNIAETCSASVSLSTLQSLSDGSSSNTPLFDPSTPFTYGPIRGSPALRNHLSNLYSAKTTSPLPPSSILITPGAIAANHLVFYALITPGTHVIVHYPTYASLYSVPASLGASVSLWSASPSNSWIPSLSALESLIQPGTTSLLVLNNPNNPTGAILPRSLLESTLALAHKHNITILVDEVYRPLFHSISPASPDFPPSILTLAAAGSDATDRRPYPNVLATGSLSKAYSLAGIRVGWIASRSPALIEACARARDYTTISVSRLDDAVAAFALSPDVVHNLIGRNIALARANLDILARWVERHAENAKWVKPLAGTTAFVRFERAGKAVDGVALAEMLMQRVGVLVVPGERCFGREWKGYVRIGFVQETAVLKEALEVWGGFMKDGFQDVPLARGGDEQGEDGAAS